MKTNFKKSLAVFLAVLMLASVFSVTAFAAAEYTITYKPGTGVEGETYTTTSTSSRLRLEDAMYTRPGYVQNGWTTTDGGTSKDYNLKQYYTKKTDITLYPYWEGVTYTITFHPDANTQTGSKTTRNARYNETVALPGAIFTRDGYIQTGWSLTEGGEKKFSVGTMSDIITGDLDLYPYWSKVYNVEYVPGQYGVGASESVGVLGGDKTDLRGALFTRDGYTQGGWSLTEGGEKAYELYQRDVVVDSDVTLYPFWIKNVYSISLSTDKLDFGDACENYSTPDKKTVVITNKSNVPVTVSVTTGSSFEASLKQNMKLMVDESIYVQVQPVAELPLAEYSEEFVVTLVDDDSVVEKVALSFSVSEHIYEKYESNGDATYTADGTKSAECVKGCGHKDTIADPGSMKVYSADNNDAVGLAPSYEYHRTVRFTAYGSGMDDAEGIVGKRFRPVDWYVNDDFNGEFEDGYDVVFTHTIFGEYTLTINYIEEEFDAATGEWVATDVTDTKTFDYTVGTTAKEEQEIVRPNTILNIIFGLFAQLLALLGIGG